MFSKAYWKSSSIKLKQTKYLAIIAIMIALKTIVSYWYIPIGENLHISFGYILVAIEATILGPIAGMMSGAITDIVEFIINPNGSFFIGYTITAMLGELIYALYFYKQKISLPRIILAKITISYIVNVFIGSFWSMILYSKGYIYYMIKSLIKNTIMLPIEIAILYTVFRFIYPILKKKNLA